MSDGQLFLNFLRYFIAKLHRLNDLDVKRLYSQFKTYSEVCELFKVYEYYECCKKIRKNNNFRFNRKFYIQNKNFFNLLKQTRYEGKKCYTITKNCLYTNSDIFSKNKFKLIEYDNILYENIAKDFLYIVSSGHWHSYYEFHHTYLNDLTEFYNLDICNQELKCQLKRTALASLPLLLKLMKKNRRGRASIRTNYFLQELYVDNFLE